MKLFKNQETMIKSHNLIRPQFSHLLNGNNNGAYLVGLEQRLNINSLNMSDSGKC